MVIVGYIGITISIIVIDIVMNIGIVSITISGSMLYILYYLVWVSNTIVWKVMVW